MYATFRTGEWIKSTGTTVMVKATMASPKIFLPSISLVVRLSVALMMRWERLFFFCFQN